MYVLKTACRSSLLFILFYQVSCFLGNYICALLYNEWCVNIWSYNSPICMIILYFLAGISILYTFLSMLNPLTIKSNNLYISIGVFTSY